VSRAAVMRPKFHPINQPSYKLAPYIFSAGLALLLPYYLATTAQQMLTGRYTGSDTGIATLDGIYLLLTCFSMWVTGCAIHLASIRHRLPYVVKLALPFAAAWAIMLLVFG